MSNKTQQLLEIDRQRVFHASTHLKQYSAGELSGRIISSGNGIRITDSEGIELIDGFAGLYCVNIGYGRTEMADAIYEQAKELAYYHTYVGHTNEALVTLSDRIIKMAPEGMSKVYYGMSGSDANETQLKLVWYYNNARGLPEKKKIISRDRGYHGSSIASGSMTGLPLFHAHFDLPLERIKHTIAPYYYRREDESMSELEFSQYCADQLETMILEEGPETVAAMIAEPVLGTGGIVPPPAGYWQAIRKVLDKYDVLLIADEVVCGFGRLGSDFGSLHYDMKPDLITVAKGLTSAYQPLSGVIVGERVWSVLENGTDQWGAIGHGYTYSGHPMGAAAANCNLDIIEREGLVQNAAEVGAYLQQRMAETFNDHPLVGDTRGVGLLHALELSSDKLRRAHFDPNLKVGPKIAAACLEQGLIARAMPHGDILGFAPPLIANRNDIDTIVDKAHQAVNKVMDNLVTSKQWQP
ncbi:TPA: aspartate aminotransferase family protein [Vibrio alginolyticus]|uniref:aspartate aminotransferase family protein n=2 Tax=Vibrio harveyi group TaxID=717610 RepID=UPI001BD564D7|nr:aspartate aminotransferase family protein [Vibrio alginolyticus]ELA8359935.1 aspartate aminotransferase family protein [Vibrio alginolyticus]MBS9959549.1 aspartate aminotransferase family protein [Vibrio alginolyticus]MBT0005422.1 aspartate aminotransferase family protein [Vibrio alginolyticus]MBT0034062.1 aspartate aminotransferase family protein [Vibrio alginolyticus]HCZ9043962.1 aspartate aminotransferase family protein [Vibrio alginolyticus]